MDVYDEAELIKDTERLLYYVEKSRSPDKKLEGLNRFFKIDDPYFAIESNAEIEKNGSCYRVPVSFEIGPSKSGYIKISTFIGSTYKTGIDDIVCKIQQLAIENIILDLRDNVGGSLENAIYLLDLFSANKEVCYIGNIICRKKFPATKKICFGLKKVIILVNGNTISAAELVALALRQNIGAVIIGDTTFGKNGIQKHFQINDKYSLRTTMCKFLVNNIDIEGQGINPDIICINCKKEIYDLYRSISKGNASFRQAVTMIQLSLRELKQFRHRISGEYDEYTILKVKKYKSERGILVNDYITKVLIDSLYKEVNALTDSQRIKAESLINEK